MQSSDKRKHQKIYITGEEDNEISHEKVESIFHNLFGPVGGGI